ANLGYGAGSLRVSSPGATFRVKQREEGVRLNARLRRRSWRLVSLGGCRVAENERKSTRSFLLLPLIPESFGLCLPIMRSERTDEEDRRATRRMRCDARLSALADGAEDPCPAQGACAIYCSRRNKLPTDRASGFR